MNNPSASFRTQSPQAYKFRYREFSTADKYSNLQMTAQKVQQLIRENQLLKQRLSFLGFNPQDSIKGNSSRNHYQHKYDLHSPGSQIILWDLEKKNQYLTKKVQKLKSEKQKQYQIVNKIKTSGKWKRNSQCGSSTCYKDKYLRYLRITSPSTEF